MLLSITLLCFFFFIICQSYLDNRCHSSWYFSLFFRRYYCRFSGSISLLWRYRLCFSPDDKAMTVKNVELYFILFTVKIWYKYKSTRSVWPNIANVFRLMNAINVQKYTIVQYLLCTICGATSRFVLFILKLSLSIRAL